MIRLSACLVIYGAAVSDTNGFAPQVEQSREAWALEFKVPAHARWSAHQDLLSFGRDHANPLSLSVVEEGSMQLLQLRITMTSHKEPLSLAVPLYLIRADRPHAFLVRYLGFRVDLFCDGVLVDEEWPIGQVQFDSGARTPTVHDPIQHARFLMRTVSDDKIEKRYGGRATIARRANEMLGPEPVEAQYMKPRGWNTNAGDAMPFYHDGTFHVFYLVDRRHHHSKWGLGAHQWAHIATTDLIHWRSYPVALPISQQWEGSICTGSVFYEKGTYYAFYATRMPDRKEHLSVALSRDGIHFEKVEPSPFSGPKAPFREGPNRDPSVSLAGDGYMMTVTAALEAKKEGKEQGALEQLVSRDLRSWSALETPFLVPGYSAQPECSDLFLWRGRYYLLFGINGVTHYRMGNSLHGPWTKPEVDVLDAGEARVMKTAEFSNGRRILVGWIGNNGFGGNLMFRELVQNPDGSLGTRFVGEMYPEPKAQMVLSPSSREAVSFLHSSPDLELRLVLRPTSDETNGSYGFTFHEDGGRTERLLVDSGAGMMEWLDASGRVSNELTNMPELTEQPILEIARKGDLVDICVNRRRTMIHRLGTPNASVSLFRQGRSAAAEAQ